MSRIELVQSTAHLAAIIERIKKAQHVAVDIESNGFFRYHERVCLVQLASFDTAFIVDPLAIEDMHPLGELLSCQSVEKIFHAADYDVRSIDRDWGFRISNLFDTSMAAGLVGATRAGLRSVLKEYIGAELAKESRLQRSDWSKRPLSKEALEYAANDVLHLSAVREALAVRLKKLSRLEWANEEFARLEGLKYTEPNREFHYNSVKGGQELNGRELAILHSLFTFRDSIAKRIDRPHFRIMSDSVLMQLSRNPDIDLTSVKGLGRYGRRPGDAQLKRAIREGIKSPPLTLTKPNQSHRKLTAEEREKLRVRLNGLRSWRKNIARDLQLNSGFVWPVASLKRLARHPESFGSELEDPVIRDWQKREFGDSLERVVADLNRAPY